MGRILRLVEVGLENPRAIGARFRGADARPFILLSSPWIQSLIAKTVLDVGANAGRWAKACRLAMPTVEICSFEPLPQCVDQMRRKMSGDPKHHIYEMALGRNCTESELNVHAQPSSSSLMLETAEMTCQNANSRTVQKLPVKIRTLDSLNADERWQPPFLLKLDVQGYELEVLAGADKVLPHVVAVVVETSFVPLYHGQPIFEDIHRFLVRAEFVYVGPGQTVMRSKNGLDMQQDSLFVRRSVLPKLNW